MSDELPVTCSEDRGSYETAEGTRVVLVVRYGDASYAVFDALKRSNGEDYDERCVEPALTSYDEADAVAGVYLDHARELGEPLVVAGL
jgi:hypothetical protein